MAWYASWIIAAAWTARTRTQMKTDMRGGHRWISMVGVMLLFSPHRLADWAPGRAALHFAFAALWPTPSTIGWVLFGLAALGFAFCWWARLHLGKLWSGFVTLKEGHHIVDTGPYGLVRHPIYSGAIFAALVTGIIRASPAGLLGAALIGIGFAMTARIEEGFLRAQLGQKPYDDYQRRVGMLIPGVG